MLTVDAKDHRALGTWWANALGWECTFDDDEEFAIELPEGEVNEERRSEDGNAVLPSWGVTAILFVRVPDDKLAKNRFHLDLRPDDQDAEVHRLETLGATRTDIGQADVPWVVLQDPENNEFCVLRSERPSNAS